MTNHANRSRGPYTAEIGGPSWPLGPTAEFATVRACRAWAEAYGATADVCAIYDHRGRRVAEHRRDRSGDGASWYRVYIG